MKRFRITALAIILLSITILNSACVFPDREPNINDIKTYKLKNLVFGKTTFDDFKTNYCDQAVVLKADDDVSVVDSVFKEGKYFKNARIGFRQGKLDWFEFYPKDQIELETVLEVYGQPYSVNKTHSDSFDYYEYDDFNIAVDKDHKQIKSFAVFNLWKEKRHVGYVGFGLPDIYSLGAPSELKPGFTLESDFQDSYTELIPYKRDKFDSKSVYYLEDKLKDSGSFYQNAIITFDNGILSSIKLEPKKLLLSDIVEIFGPNYSIEPLNSNYYFYDFKNFVIVVDNKDKKVINIGVVGSI